MPSLIDYLAYVTSEHAQAPRFLAALAAAVRPFADMQIGILGMPQLYDLDNAIGAQLDTVGLWVGVSRNVSINSKPAFSFDFEARGFDQGWWSYPGDIDPETNVLDDSAYRILLRARIVNNHWSGGVEQAYQIWETLFAGTGYAIELYDNQDMTMNMTLLCPSLPPDPIVLALLQGGYLDIKPAAVRMRQRSAAQSTPSSWDDGDSVWDDGDSVWDVRATA